MSTRLLGARRQKRLLGLHRTLAWMGLTALGLHAGALLLDPTIGFGPAEVLVPFAASWNPVAVAGGVIAGWLMVILVASFRFRNRIGQRAWRGLHYASFAAFLLALIHAITSGTDLAGVGGRCSRSSRPARSSGWCSCASSPPGGRHAPRCRRPSHPPTRVPVSTLISRRT